MQFAEAEGGGSQQSHQRHSHLCIHAKIKSGQAQFVPTPRPDPAKAVQQPAYLARWHIPLTTTLTNVMTPNR